MRLNKTTHQAIRILVACAGSANAERIKVQALADTLDIPLQNSFKIVNLLVRAGFLDASRGRHGGVRLAQSADALRLGDVVRRFESASFETDAADLPVLAGAAPLLDEATEAFLSVLNAHSIADMAKGASKTAPQDAFQSKDHAAPAEPSAKRRKRVANGTPSGAA